MGVDTRAILLIGKEFSDESQAIEFFQAKSKIKLTEDDIDEIGCHLEYWLEPRIKKGYPKCGHYNMYSMDGYFYIGYDVYDANIEKMQKKIVVAMEKWNNIFKVKPQLVQGVIYF